MKDWFEGLAQREQIFVGGGALVVVIAIFYTLIWVPLDTGQEALTTEVAMWQRSLAQLKPLTGMQALEAGNATSGAVTDSRDPIVIVDQTLRARGLDRALQRSQPVSTNGIRVEFDNVAFDELVLWLGDLSSKHGLLVSSGSMSQTSQSGPGRINATFTLERG